MSNLAKPKCKLASFLFCVLVVQSTSQPESNSNKNTHIAVVGAGIGGASATHYLRSLFGPKAVIDVYEAKKHGGRLDTIKVGGNVYESGATIIHQENLYMHNFLEMFGLQKRSGPASPSKLGLYNGEGFVFESSDSEYSLLTMGKVIWRYGLDMFNLHRIVSDAMDSFKKIYELQEDHQAFTTVDYLLSSLSSTFPDRLKISLRDELKRQGFNDLLIDEIIMAGIRTNYGQTPDLHAFVGLVCMAGIQSGMWSVQGGNYLIVEKLLVQAAASLKMARVVKIAKLPDSAENNFRVTFTSSFGTEAKDYDIVIVATPLHSGMSKIQFENFPKPIKELKTEFHRTVATFVQGRPNISYFGIVDEAEFPTSLLTTNKNLFFNSIGLQTPVDYNPKTAEPKQLMPVYKIFSQLPLTHEQLDLIFSEYEDLEVVDWLAYPHYSSSEKDVPSFVLDKHLYYANAMEIAASAMEMSVVGARNSAILAYNNWHSKTQNIDNPGVVHITVSDHTEL